MSFVINLSKSIKINIPLNLKYLVSQFKIVNQVATIKNNPINEFKQ